MYLHTSVIECRHGQDAKKYYLVLEICEGGELFDRIVEKVLCTKRRNSSTSRRAVPLSLTIISDASLVPGCLSWQQKSYNEKEARDLVRILFDALKYCHDSNVVHRDLKVSQKL